MKRLLLVLILFLLPSVSWAQCNGVFAPNTICGTVAGGIPGQVSNSVLTGIPGGSAGQIEYNSAGTFGGFTMSGDCLTNTSTGVIICTKTNGVAFGPPATGSASGNTTTFATTLGVFTAGDCIKVDVNNNFIDAGQTCGGLPSNAWATPEQYGAVGNNSTDDATAFQSLCADISAGNVHWVRMSAGKTYKVWTTAPTTQSVLCNIGAAKGVRWDFNGAQFNVAYTGTSITYIFLMSGAQDVTINDLTGTAATGKHVSGDNTGVNWVQSACISPCAAGFGVQNLAVSRFNINGGITGVAIVRGFGVGAYSNNIKISGISTNCGYAVANEADGTNTVFDITTVNNGRSYIGYNVSNVTGNINSTNGTSPLEDVYITSYGFVGDISLNTTTNIGITYTNQATTTYGAGFFGIAHQQGDPVNASIPTNISNIRLSMSVVLNSSPNTFILTSISTTGTSSTQAPGDPGNIENNIILEGRIQGDLNAATAAAGYYMSTAEPSAGWNGTSKGTFIMQNLQAPSLTKQWFIGTGANIEFRNANIPNSSKPVFDTGSNPNFQTYRNSIFNGSGQYPINSGGFLQSCAIGVNFNAANSDTAFAIPSPSANWRLVAIAVSNASASISTATLGIFSAAAGGGQTIAANQALTVTTGAANTNNNLQFLNASAGFTTTVALNYTQLFARVGTAQGSAATADVCVQFSPLL